MPTGPWSNVNNKLSLGQNVTIQTCGDSVTYGWNGFSVDANHGWAGRLGILIGQVYDYNVSFTQFNPGSTPAYATPIALYSSKRGSLAPTLLIRNGGINFAAIQQQALTYLTQGMLNKSDPDVIITGYGFNDIQRVKRTNAQFVADYQNFITLVQNTYCPGVPIIVTTEDSCGPSVWSVMYPAWNALIAGLGINQSIPLLPKPSVVSPTYSGVWMLDTMQAFNGTQPLPMTLAYFNANVSKYLNDAAHCNPLGYQTWAEWLFQQIVAEPTTYLPSITTTQLDDITYQVAFSQTIQVVSATTTTWAIAAGQLPYGLTLGTSTGVISGVPQFGGPYDFTVSATNDSGSATQRFTGNVILNFIPLVADTVPTFKRRALNLYYPVQPKIKVSGAFQNFVPRS
jgi:lysophospholipase L1-like esterase